MSSDFSIGQLAQTLEVSRSGYYVWRKGQDQAGPRACQNAVLLAHIRCLHKEHKGRYGSPRMHQALRQQGVRCGHRRASEALSD